MALLVLFYIQMFLPLIASILHSVCSTTSRSYTGETEFLTSPSYPADIPSSNTDCICSVELNDCDARIQIYTLHMEFSEAYVSY